MNINDNLMINLKNNLFNENSIKKYSNNFILTPQKRVKLERYIERVHNGILLNKGLGSNLAAKMIFDIFTKEDNALSSRDFRLFWSGQFLS